MHDVFSATLLNLHVNSFWLQSLTTAEKVFGEVIKFLSR